MPWPSGPVVASIPAASPRSGWPAVGLPSWRKFFEVVERQPVAGQVQRRVQQHRRVPGREHEAVAVEPVRVGRVVLHHPRVQQVRQRGEGHRRAGMAGLGLLDGVHRERADRVDRELVQLRAGRHSALSVVVACVRGVSRFCASTSWAASTAAPIIPAFVPALGQRDRACGAAARAARGSSASWIARSRNRWPARDRPPPIVEPLGLEDVHVAGDRDAEHARRSSRR